MQRRTLDLSGVSQIDWARLAAFIDGEGHVKIVSKMQTVKGRRYQQEWVSVTIANTSPLLMLWLGHNFGGSCQVRQLQKSHYKKSWNWVCGSAQGANVLQGCLPYFIIKRDQAELALAFYATVKRRGVKGTPQSIRDERKVLQTKLRVLTARGVKAEQAVG